MPRRIARIASPAIQYQLGQSSIVAPAVLMPMTNYKTRK